MSQASSGVVCSILSKVNPAAKGGVLTTSRKANRDQRTIIDNMIDLAVFLNSSIYDPFGEIICPDIARYRKGVPSCGLDFLFDYSKFICVDTNSRLSNVKQLVGDTYSLITTFAPSLAKIKAALRPIPYMQEIDK